ncbi:aldose epimerase family protein [Plebeiibacterium sediminum]|uniref:Aldose 1-epimerase n=1 Tax=Plebeiibacterium sediminum TaxID=2992112 RepID=A0AAE3SG76_9BACT|nr:aldose epimerase family protein [Plebeiobacterium sediminum]MCW3788026.1 galactose mutarotase [Plebeiobacterium sediminum]
MRKYIGVFLFFVLIWAVGCQVVSEKKNNSKSQCSLKPESFLKEIDGKTTDLFWLKNDNGLKIAITNYGGRVVGLWVPDKNGNPVDVVVGFNSVDDYQNSTEPYFGALIGRVGNRIANGKFVLDGVEYTLPTNNGVNTLHGGVKGFQDVVWDVQQSTDSTLILSYVSEDGSEGFPGNLEVQVAYLLTSNNGLKISYEAKTDKRTPVNLTNHAFFNLNGEGSGTIVNHRLMIDADKYTPVDETLIPTGKLESVENTPFDFRTLTTIGSRLDTLLNIQLKFGKGYDHNYVLNQKSEDALQLVASVIGDVSGIQMDVYTVEPGLQFYSGNFMQSQNTLKCGVKDDFRTAFCLETQHFPDALNQPDFPSITLDPESNYKTVSEYKFSVR